MPKTAWFKNKRSCFTNSRSIVILSASSRQVRPEGEIFLVAVMLDWQVERFLDPKTSLGPVLSIAAGMTMGCRICKATLVVT
jgi:hypothetical protein